MAAGRNKDSGNTPTDLGGLTMPGAFVAATETVEKNTDSAWAAWQEANAQADPTFAPTAPQTDRGPPGFDRRYAQTAPGTFASGVAAKAATAAAKFVPHPKAVTVDEAMVEVRKNNRVCPKPARWLQAFELLPDREPSKPTPPLSGAAWTSTPSISKRMVLREHLDWAASRGALGPLLNFLKSLPEDEWHHMGD